MTYDAKYKDNDLCQDERDHNYRAAGLRLLFNQEALAGFLHQTYRAAFKALHLQVLPKHMRSIDSVTGLPYPKSTRSCTSEHDHGFSSCHKKAYFMRRAKHLLTDICR